MINKRIEKLKARLLLEQPYFGQIALGLKPKLNENIQAFATSNNTFEYNDNFIDTLSDDELIFTLTNASMHYALNYEKRQGSRITWLWKLAQDYAINSLLVKNNLKAPLVVNHNIRFDSINAESIYEILKDEIDAQEELKDNLEHINKEVNNQDTNINDESDLQNATILHKAKKYGDLPLDIQILVPNINEGQINWKDELYEAINHTMKFDYTLIPPNKRYAQYGIALPSLSGSMIKIVIAIDSSGSIDDNTLDIFLSEVESIMTSFSSFEIDLIVADAKIQSHTVLYPTDTISRTICGGGGTNFEIVFEYIQNNINDVNLCLYFTDGMGKMPQNNYDFETIWILTNDEVSVPFGNKIIL